MAPNTAAETAHVVFHSSSMAFAGSGLMPPLVEVIAFTTNTSGACLWHRRPRAFIPL